MHKKERVGAKDSKTEEKEDTHRRERGHIYIYHVMQSTHKILYIVYIYTRFNSCVNIYYVH